MEFPANFKEHHPEIFGYAVKESAETLALLEKELVVVLPTPVRLFWLTCGSGLSNAAPSARMSIEATGRFRGAVQLPTKYLVLDERGDAGAVLLDTQSAAGEVLWVSTYALEKVGRPELAAAEYDSYASFFQWVSYCVQEARGAL